MKLRKLTSKGIIHWATIAPIAVIILVAAVGVRTFRDSHAATPASVEGSSAAASAKNAKVLSCGTPTDSSSAPILGQTFTVTTTLSNSGSSPYKFLTYGLLFYNNVGSSPSREPDEGNIAAGGSKTITVSGQVPSSINGQPTTSVTFTAQGYYKNADNRGCLLSWNVPSPPSSNPPTQPTNLTVSSVSATLATLKWGKSTAVNGLVGYNIIRGTSPDSEVTIYESSTLTNYKDSTVLPNTTYYYQVEGIDSLGYVSQPSNTVTVTVP